MLVFLADDKPVLTNHFYPLWFKDVCKRKAHIKKIIFFEWAGCLY